MNFKNAELIQIGNFLQTLTLPAQISRARTKLVKSLNDSLKELSEGERQLVTDFGGEVTEQGQISWTDGVVPDGYNDEHAVLLNEQVTIELNQPTLMNALKEYFAKWDGEIDPQYAEAFDAFFDALETEEEK
ncbi:hypothetical protein ACFQGR_01555 [Weissella sagaensis]|uniref:Uncharacterized protein n=1 Tax=Weissella sagaensis TaxID=2559928 RepID=A0ABW1RRQ4_9LACO|nr:hypothetical protein [Weissella sagaensis]